MLLKELAGVLTSTLLMWRLLNFTSDGAAVRNVCTGSCWWLSEEQWTLIYSNQLMAFNGKGTSRPVYSRTGSSKHSTQSQQQWGALCYRYSHIFCNNSLSKEFKHLNSEKHLISKFSWACNPTFWKPPIIWNKSLIYLRRDYRCFFWL